MQIVIEMVGKFLLIAFLSFLISAIWGCYQWGKGFREGFELAERIFNKENTDADSD